MIIDTSVFMAILLAEPEASALLDAMDEAARMTLSAGSWVELSAVVTRGGLVEWHRVVDLRDAYEIGIEPVSERQALLAAEAYRTFGRGTQHAAKLNFGDCFAYALAMDRGEPLLFKGDDFSRTDVQTASY